MDTDGDPALVDDHQIVLIGHGTDSYEFARLVRDVEGLHTLRATVRLAVVFYHGALTVALFTDDENGLFGVLRYGEHTDDFVSAVIVEGHTTHPSSIAAHSTDSGLVEAYCTTVAVRDEDFAITIGQTDTHQLVIVDEVDGDDPIGTRTRVSLEEGLLDRTALGAEDEVMRVHELSITRQVLHADEGIDAVACLDVEEVLQGTALSVLSALGDLVDLEPVAAAHLGEEQHRLVHRSRVDVLDEVFVARITTLSTDTATSL